MSLGFFDLLGFDEAKDSRPLMRQRRGEIFFLARAHSVLKKCPRESCQVLAPYAPSLFFSFFFPFSLSFPCLVLTPGLLVIKRALVPANVISKVRLLAE